MFVDFDKVFNEDEQAQLKVPSALVQYLSKQLPNGVKYKLDKDGNCFIVGENEKFTFGGILFKPTEEQKKILGKKYTGKDILNYSYNAQKPLSLKLKKDGFVLINGEEYPVNQLYYNPLCPIKYNSGEFQLIPQKFPTPFSVKIGCEKYERELMVSRVPNESVNIAQFESNKNESLSIQFFLNESDKEITLSVSYNLLYAKTVQNIVETIKIYNAFIDGKGYICGTQLNSKLSGENIKRIEDNSVEFWEKVLELEKVLEVKFIPPEEDIDYNTVCLVEQLYQNLVKTTPVRERKKIDTIDGEWNPISENKIEDAIGKQIYFEFEMTMKLELFGVEKKLYGLLGIFNAVLSDYSKKGNKQKITLSDEKADKQRYTVALYFKDEIELKNYRKKKQDEYFEDFRDAKDVNDYLDKR